MYTNIGGKIKGMAKFFCWMGIIFCVIYGIIMIVQGSQLSRYSYSYEQQGTGLILGGVAMALAGSVLSWLGSLVLYGFGELIDRSISIDKSLMISKSSGHQVGTAPGKTASTPAAPKAQTIKTIDDGIAIDNFLKEIEPAESVVDIWKIWRNYNLDRQYYDVQDYIRNTKDQEQLYGQSESIEEVKKTIRRAFGR